MEDHHFSFRSLQRLLWKLLKCLILGTAGITGVAGVAEAHVLPAGQGSLHLKGSQVFLVLAVPLSVVPQADRNGDGKIDAEELNDQAPALIERIQKGLVIRATGIRTTPQPMQWQHSVMSLPHEAGDSELTAPKASAYLHFMGSGQFQGAPQGLQVSSDLWGSGNEDTLKLKVTRSGPGLTDEQEVGLLSARHPQFNFFAPGLELAQRFAQHGLEHILSGADHLLFLVVLLASAVHWRRWLVLLTGFTIAHGLTFGLAALGWVQFSTQWVESLIAASIVLVAAMSLARVELSLGLEVVLVFVLGLVHGLGFAASLQADTSSTLSGLERSPLLGIVSFNLGVEIGQVLVAAGLLLVLTLLRRAFRLSSDLLWQRSAAVFGCVVGSYWLWERSTSL
mgnify:CR=1 FL=1